MYFIGKKTPENNLYILLIHAELLSFVYELAYFLNGNPVTQSELPFCFKIIIYHTFTYLVVLTGDKF